MLKQLKDLFRVVEVSGTETQRRTQLAAAALLIELSKADFQRDPREQNVIVTAIRNTFQLDETTLAELLADAENASARATSLYEFTSEINAQCSDEEKFGLIRELWRVANADGNIDKYEDHLIKRIADLIYVSHSQCIKAKWEVLNQ